MALFKAYSHHSDQSSASEFDQNDIKQNTPRNIPEQISWLENASYSESADQKFNELQSHLQSVPVEDVSDQIAIEESQKSFKHTDNEIKCSISKSTNLKLEKTAKKRSYPCPPPEKVFVEDFDDLTSDDAFRIDRSKETYNWTYESIYKSYISKYDQRFDYAASLKTNDNIKLDKIKSKKLRKLRPQRYFHKKSLIKDDNQDTNDAGDKIMENTGCSEHNLNLPAHSLAVLSTSYNRRLHETPHDEKLWLEFVNFQDKISSQKLDAVREKKLAILDKALSHNPASVSLKVKKIELLSKSIDYRDVLKEWEALLFVHSGNGELWKKYLLFLQCSLSHSSVSHVVNEYHRCFTAIDSILSGSTNSIDTSEDLSYHRLVIFIQFCWFLKQVSYVEKAIACFQSQIEFNIFTPSALRSASLEERRIAFESFWESNCPVLGENDALGWSLWYDMQTSVFSSTDNDIKDEENLLKQSSLRNEIWSAIENYRSENHLLRWRPDLTRNETEDDCEDIDRLVLVDDVIPTLGDVPEDLWFELILGFLHLLEVNTSYHSTCELSTRLKSLVIYNCNTVPYVRHPFTVPFCNNQMVYCKNVCNVIRNILKQSSRVFIGERHDYLLSVLFHFESTLVIFYPYDNLEKEIRSLKKSLIKIARKNVKNVLKQSENRNSLPLMIAYISFERRLDNRKEAKSIIETVLASQTNEWFSSEDKSNKLMKFKLYLLYLQIVMTISDYNLPVRETTNNENIIEGRVDEAAHIFYSLSTLVKPTNFSGQRYSSVDMLKIRQKLMSELSSLIEEVSAVVVQEKKIMLEMIQTYANCVMIFEYLSSSIDACGKLFSTVIKGHLLRLKQTDDLKVLEIINLLHEHLTMSHLSLICFHSNISHKSLNYLRFHLLPALNDFPENSYILKIYIELESRSFIIGRLRRHFNEYLPKMTSPLPVLYWICAELRRLLLLKSQDSHGHHFENDSIRRLRVIFERAINYDSCQLCVFLWRLYILFEFHIGDKNRAVGILYSAIRQCPWAKIIYQEAVSLFPDKMDEIIDLMQEREIRIYLPTEELDLLIKSKENSDCSST